ncbi:hypothetical protein, partial [Shewanella salipaludis]|uniref:hypothetical protein n=1 Tax=Shewanella salipaludis TaxID=2723052 RepID=UPI001B7CE559
RVFNTYLSSSRARHDKTPASTIYLSLEETAESHHLLWVALIASNCFCCMSVNKHKAMASEYLAEQQVE